MPLKFGTFLLAASLLLPASAALAGGAMMSGAQMRHTIAGKTVYLRISGFEVPIQYFTDGRMKASISTVAASFGRADVSSYQGNWWVKNDQLCQSWSGWLAGKPHCYRLSQSGNIVHWVRDDGRSGTARIGE